jgi:hypothetical protein
LYSNLEYAAILEYLSHDGAAEGLIQLAACLRHKCLTWRMTKDSPR